MDTRIMIRDGDPSDPTTASPRSHRPAVRRRAGHRHPRRRQHARRRPARRAAARVRHHRLPRPHRIHAAEPPKVNWAGIGSRPAADAALFAGTLTLASQLATYASPGQAATGQAAAIGDGDGRDAARRALGASTPETCKAIVKGLDDGDHMVYDMFPTPALSGEHGISYDAVDLAADLGLDRTATP